MSNLYISSICDLKIPLLIPRRAKGHAEVLGTCKVSVGGEKLVDPSNFVHFFTLCAHHTCLNETPEIIAKSIFKDLSVININLEIGFLLPLDRVSSTYLDTIFNLSCRYNVTGDDVKNLIRSMTISVPVLLFDTRTILGYLQLILYNPVNTHFEDMLDTVQKYAGVIIYPVSSVEDRNSLDELFIKKYNPGECLIFLRDFYRKCSNIRGGKATVFAEDVYNIYKFEQSIEF